MSELPIPLPGNTLIHVANHNQVLAAFGCTFLWSLLKPGTPGVLLKSMAVLSVWPVGISITDYVNTRLANKSVAEQTGQRIKPGKLWEQTGKLSMDDGALLGCAVGLLAALRRRAFPGVTGWKRFVGAGMLGFAAGDEGSLRYFQYSGQYDEASWAYAPDKMHATNAASGAGKPQTQLQHNSAQRELAPPGTFIHFADANITHPRPKYRLRRDYHWKPGPDASELVSKHIKELEEEAGGLANEMNLIRPFLERKEQELFRMQDTNDESWDMLRREIHVLQDFYYRYGTRSLELLFMIIETERYQKELEAIEAGEPLGPADAAALVPNDRSPDLSVSLLRQQWNGLRAMDHTVG